MYNKQEGIISHIQKLSMHDGAGIRTTLFFKGCDLRCKWCHNPETFSMQPELEWIRTKCIACGTCIDECPEQALSIENGIIRREQKACTLCLRCIHCCYSEAHHLIGRKYTVQEVCNRVEEDRPIFERSGGGVTISGGEPMMQYSFLFSLVKELAERDFHICLQTNMTSEWKRYECLLPYIHYVMCDLKHMDPVKHHYWTGKENKQIVENIQRLDKSGTNYCVRTPVIPGVNDTIQDMEAIASFTAQLRNADRPELLPYHPLAGYKYKNLGKEYPFEKIPEILHERFLRLKKIIEK